MVHIIVDGEPVPKGRPRFTMRAGFPQSYTPEKTVEYEKRVRDAYKNGEGEFFADKPIEVMVEAFFPVPRSMPKKRRALMEQGFELHCKRPDLDNVVKAVLDALNGTAYEDDCRIIRLKAEKWYSDRPRTEITIKEIEQ